MKQILVIIQTLLLCPQARQHKLPYTLSEIHTTKIFDLIHVDTWGPYHTPTQEGYKYFVIIVDDFSRVTWTFLVTTKRVAGLVLKNFVQMIETQFQIRLNTIRTDNAFELGSSLELRSFFTKKKGITHQTICPHTPQQNGVVERKHKNLLKTSRALLFQSKLPIRFWGDCVLTTTFLINRFPSRILNNKTPNEVLFGTPPIYSNLKTFGCLCFVLTMEKHRDKFLPRGMTGVFIDYYFGKKGYKVLILDSL